MEISKLAKKIRAQVFETSGPVKNPKCREFEVSSVVLSKFVVEKLIPLVGHEPYPVNELVLMAGALCRVAPTHLFEWGTNIGKSARVFCETSRRFRLGTEIHSVDLPDHVGHQEHPGNRRGELVRGYGDVVLHQGDGVDTSFEIARTIPVDSRLMFFLDGDHSYESVVRELTAIMTRHPGASILVHDTFFQSPESHYNTGPFRAIDTCLGSVRSSYQVITTNTGLPGMVLLYHPIVERQGL